MPLPAAPYAHRLRSKGRNCGRKPGSSIARYHGRSQNHAASTTVLATRYRATVPAALSCYARSVVAP
eukprot:2705938-Rhodomonas_salina.2